MFTKTGSPSLTWLTAGSVAWESSHIIQIRKNIDKKRCCQRSKVNRQSQWNYSSCEWANVLQSETATLASAFGSRSGFQGFT